MSIALGCSSTWADLGGPGHRSLARQPSHGGWRRAAGATEDASWPTQTARQPDSQEEDRSGIGLTITKMGPGCNDDAVDYNDHDDRSAPTAIVDVKRPNNLGSIWT